MRVTVIISAYKNLAALKHCLHAYSLQTRRPQQIIVAEDDQGRDIKDYLAQLTLDEIALLHVSQPNQGFRKCKIMNQAIQHAIGDLLLFTDADCITRDDFVAQHVKKSRRGWFLSGGSHINLPQDFHQQHDIAPLIDSQRLFDYDYLKTIDGFDKDRLRLTRNAILASCLDLL